MLNWFSAHPRRVFGLVAAACAAMLAFGLYLQHVVGLEPCPMCIVQRYALILVGALALLAVGCAAKLVLVGFVAVMLALGSTMAAWVSYFLDPNVVDS